MRILWSLKNWSCSFIDMNECSEKTAGCAQVCTNTIGSFKCSCTTGYYLGTDLKYCNGKFSSITVYSMQYALKKADAV